MTEEDIVINPDVAISGIEEEPITEAPAIIHSTADSEEEGALSDAGSPRQEENAITEQQQEPQSQLVENETSDTANGQDQNEAINAYGSNDSDGQISTDNEEEDDGIISYPKTTTNGFNKEMFVSLIDKCSIKYIHF